MTLNWLFSLAKVSRVLPSWFRGFLLLTPCKISPARSACKLSHDPFLQQNEVEYYLGCLFLIVFMNKSHISTLFSRAAKWQSGAPYQVRPARPRSYLDFLEKRGKGKVSKEHFWKIASNFLLRFARTYYVHSINDFSLKYKTVHKVHMHVMANV